MRVMLIHPGVPAYGGKEAYRTFYPPIGLACIAAPLLEAGHEVAIMDTSIEGIDRQAMLSRVADYKPDLVGLRCQFINYPLGLDHAAAIKQALPSTRIVFGGPHMGLVGEQAINDHDFIDTVIHGEGEEPLLEYVTALEDGSELRSVGNLVWRDEHTGQAVRNAAREVKRGDLLYPPPAYHLLPMHLFRFTNFFTLEGHRGCPMRCTFCSLPQVQTHRVRYKPPMALVDEMTSLVYDYGINRFEFIEVNFTIHKGWAMEVCDLIRQRRLPVHWICRSYPELVDRPTLAAIRDAGCYRIYFGIESGSAKILRNYRKITTVEQGRAAIALVKDLGMEMYCDFMLGGPGETRETAEETLRFIEETQPTYSDISLVVPFPGTEIYEKAEQHGVRIANPRWYEDLATVSQFPYVRVMELDTLSLRELESLWLHAVTRINGIGKG
jgi:anaerobic magnesium-protoporphyrin IX monomethyl ester cyclase